MTVLTLRAEPNMAAQSTAATGKMIAAETTATKNVLRLVLAMVAATRNAPSADTRAMTTAMKSLVVGAGDKMIMAAIEEKLITMAAKNDRNPDGRMNTKGLITTGAKKDRNMAVTSVARTNPVVVAF